MTGYIKDGKKIYEVEYSPENTQSVNYPKYDWATEKYCKILREATEEKTLEMERERKAAEPVKTKAEMEKDAPVNSRKVELDEKSLLQIKKMLEGVSFCTYSPPADFSSGKIIKVSGIVEIILCTIAFLYCFSVK